MEFKHESKPVRNRDLNRLQTIWDNAVRNIARLQMETEEDRLMRLESAGQNRVEKKDNV